MATNKIKAKIKTFTQSQSHIHTFFMGISGEII